MDHKCPVKHIFRVKLSISYEHEILGAIKSWFASWFLPVTTRIIRLCQSAAKIIEANFVLFIWNRSWRLIFRGTYAHFIRTQKSKDHLMKKFLIQISIWARFWGTFLLNDGPYFSLSVWSNERTVRNGTSAKSRFQN